MKKKFTNNNHVILCDNCESEDFFHTIFGVNGILNAGRLQQCSVFVHLDFLSEQSNSISPHFQKIYGCGH